MEVFSSFVGRLLSIPAMCLGMVASGSLCLPVQAEEASALASASGTYAVEEVEGGIEIRLDGKLVTKYWPSHTAKPILWPLVGPTGDELTRGYPMRDASPTERNDHVHHRSFWMTHGEVNGIDFWAEGDNRGKITQVGDAKVTGGDTATLDATHEWRGPDGKRVLTDRWQLTFNHDEKTRWIDCVFSLTATDGDVVFGDTKEGSFGIRVAGTMKTDAKQGGELVNAEGQNGKAAWGKPSPWVDYFGPVNGTTQGIAILNHPNSYGYPTRWHVRTYGLFAANPFGESHFTGGKRTAGKRLPAGETWTLGYRVILHKGDTEAAGIPKAWQQYSAQSL